jgi:hypothetical protein
MEMATENIETLKKFLKAPCLGVVSFQPELPIKTDFC